MFLESSDVIFRVSIALLEHHKDAIMARDNFEEIMDYLKNVLPNIDAATIAAVMRRAFALDVLRPLAEYQVEYNVLQEEMTSQNDHLEALNRAKEANRQLETQLQIAQSSVAQLEKTRFTQQSQLQSLSSQVQSLEVTVETLGAFINRLVDTRHDIEFPGEIRRIVQQIQNATEQRKAVRRSANNMSTYSLPLQQQQPPQFLDRKISKSLSMNSHLGVGGLMLRVLEEDNESSNELGSPKVRGSAAAAAGASSSSNSKRSPFFENTFEQIRQQKSAMRLNSFASEGAKKSPYEVDSGIATPLSPQQMSPAANTSKSESQEQQQQQQSHKSDDDGAEEEPSIEQRFSAIEDESAVVVVEARPENMHPLSACNDVTFQFSGGTTPLKSIKSGGRHQVLPDGEKNGGRA